MKNLGLALFLVLAMAGSAFAFLDPDTNVNTNVNTNVVGQQQGMVQWQSISQTIDPKQINEQSTDITFQGPKRTIIGIAPNAMAPSELNFITPNQRDITLDLPRFGFGDVRPLSKHDCIYDVLYSKEGVKIDSLYKEILKALRSTRNIGVSVGSMRLQVIECGSTKSWTTGGSLGANGVGTAGTGSVGGGGSLFPQIGRSKTSNLYTIYIVAIQLKP